VEDGAELVVGLVVGKAEALGSDDGLDEGAREGKDDGTADSDGMVEGATDGENVGVLEGARLGRFEGISLKLGLTEGKLVVGPSEGILDGLRDNDGVELGSFVGDAVDGEYVGKLVGGIVGLLVVGWLVVGDSVGPVDGALVEVGWSAMKLCRSLSVKEEDASIADTSSSLDCPFMSNTAHKTKTALTTSMRLSAVIT